ncbi:MAG: FliG C-terminal domain-containing protein [Bdellovibrionota bacterium]
MGIYTRYKKSPDGFRQLVELLESTPSIRRKKMIDAGMAEDPEYTEEAMKFVFTFEDVLALPDNEMAELVNQVPPRVTAFAIAKLNDDVKDRMYRCGNPRMVSEVKEYLSGNVEMRDIGGAQLKMVEALRKLEKRGMIKTKRIPA